MTEPVRPMKNFRLAVGIIAVAWAVVTLALLGGVVQTGMEWGDAVFLWTLAAAICATIGAAVTFTLQRWGAILYLIASGSLIIQAWLVEWGEMFDFGWGYVALFALFAMLVAGNWRAMARDETPPA